MTQLRGPDAFYQIGSAILEGVEAALEDSTGGPVNRSGMVPGEVAWDECDCGLLTGTLARTYRSDTFPQVTQAGVTSDLSACDPPWRVGELVLLVVRCAPVPAEGQLAPSAEALDAAAAVLVSDEYVLDTAARSRLCELRRDDQIIDFVMLGVSSVGPGGGCVGVQLRVHVAVEA